MEKELKKLTNAREVMEAFLAGKRLIWNGYGNDAGGEDYLYLEDTGYIAEEDGAGAKSFRVDFTWRGEEPNWRVLE